MNTKLLDLIRQLSISDPKTLSQKALKACEEVGELAKVVLPFEDAFACKHRFVDKRAILEEVADVILTVQSIAYNLDFDDEELEEMIKEKALYWSELQSREIKAKFPVPFEIHVTVANSNEISVSAFKEDCQKLNVKPILLDLQNNSKTVMHDLMTSSVHIGNNSSAYSELMRISDGLAGAGYKVVRKKIETVPWHPAAPSEDHLNPTMPPDCYFECHLAIITCEEKLSLLEELVKDCDCHLSRNILKKLDNKYFKIMATYRQYTGTRGTFESTVQDIRDKLITYGFTVDKLITEFSIYDSKVSHDAEWLNNG